MCSLVIKIAILVHRAVVIEIIIPALRFNIADVLELIVEADPIKNPVITSNTFFLFKLLYFFFQNLLSILRDFNIFS